MLRRMMLRKRFWSTAWDAVIFSVFGMANQIDSEYFSDFVRGFFVALSGPSSYRMRFVFEMPADAVRLAGRAVADICKTQATLRDAGRSIM